MRFDNILYGPVFRFMLKEERPAKKKKSKKEEDSDSEEYRYQFYHLLIQ